MSRIQTKFAELKSKGRCGLVTFITAGDPDVNTSQTILNDLANSGADFIELGMPFSDPMADGPIIQMASSRALKGHMTVDQTLQMVKSFRSNDPKTPIILMGYYNPIYNYGPERFAEKAFESGVDGVIVVDLPPEEDHEFHDPARDAGLDLIRLITPTTDDDRLKTIISGASGFLYYVSITGVTGTESPQADQLRSRIEHIRNFTELPIAIGFGIKTERDASEMSQICDAIVIGSSIVEIIAGIPKGLTEIQDVSSKVKKYVSAL